MRVMVDLNVVLDVVQERQPHYAASAAVLSQVVTGDLEGFLPPHALPTLYYIVERYAGAERAGSVVDWLLRHFEVAEAGKTEFLQARRLGFEDFEDAVVAACAAQARCEFVLTRNIADFRDSPVPSMTPEEFLAKASGDEV